MPPLTSIDREFLQQALEQATEALYLPSPNPRVGCVLVSPHGLRIAQGHTQVAGDAHAEVMALRNAAQLGHATHNATAYVTLEPCCHHGKTAPCTQALIDAGLSRVVVALPDPNPEVCGGGVNALVQAGIAVDVVPQDDPLAKAAREINIGFIHRMQTGMPWVRVKAAASLDGITALPSGQSQWITGQAAREDAHHWRARACAILSGIGTVTADNPRLDVRHVRTVRQPTLVLVDSKLEVSPTARLFAPASPARQIWIYTANAAQAPAKKLRALGAQITVLPDEAGKVDLRAMIQDLGARQINELHVEAGFKLNGSLLRASLVDEWLIYLAPLLLGTGAGIANATPTTLEAARPLRLQSLEPLGDDWRGIWRYATPGDNRPPTHSPPHRPASATVATLPLPTGAQA